MSRENVEAMRASIEAFNRRDIEKWATYAARDFEWVDMPQLPDADVRSGDDALLRWLTDFLANWGEFRVEIEELIDADDKVVAVGRVHARGRSSGASVDNEVAYVTTFRDGKMIRTEPYADKADALAAAGL
jgi:ketosteroid isomerase-like protein